MAFKAGIWEVLLAAAGAGFMWTRSGSTGRRTFADHVVVEVAAAGAVDGDGRRAAGLGVVPSPHHISAAGRGEVAALWVRWYSKRGGFSLYWRFSRIPYSIRVLRRVVRTLRVIPRFSRSGSKRFRPRPTFLMIRSDQRSPDHLERTGDRTDLVVVLAIEHGPVVVGQSHHATRIVLGSIARRYSLGTK